MQCVGTKSISDASGNNITIFDVKEKQSGAHLYYSPNIGFLATALIQPQLSMLNGFVTLPGGSITNSVNLNTEISMTSADPANATDGISRIGSYQGVEPVSLKYVRYGNTGIGTRFDDDDNLHSCHSGHRSEILSMSELCCFARRLKRAHEDRNSFLFSHLFSFSQSY